MFVNGSDLRSFSQKVKQYDELFILPEQKEALWKLVLDLYLAYV